MIKVNNLSKEFHEQGTSNELLAVDHVDFTIQNGSFCALVGESGSGKSTLAQLMCGLLVPSSGEVLFEGKNISLCRGKQKQVLRSKIQLILQDGKGAMDPRFTVYQIIAEPIRNFRKLSKKEEEREINDLLNVLISVGDAAVLGHLAQRRTVKQDTKLAGISSVRAKSFSGKNDFCLSEVTVLFFCADVHIAPPVCKK